MFCEIKVAQLLLILRLIRDLAQYIHGLPKRGWQCMISIYLNFSKCCHSALNSKPRMAKHL
ncbi:hypothetical protein XENE109146_12870 [Xenorhabdus nematophila]